MTLPAAYATLSMGDINVELGRSRTATISLDAAENGSYGAINQASSSRPSASNPASISEWYGYNHNASSGPVLTYVYLYYGGNATAACSGTNAGYFYVNNGSFNAASQIYSNSSGTTAAPSNYYSDGVKRRFWYGTIGGQFTAGVNCPINCFVKGTLITLSSGIQVPIETLYDNQLLMSSIIETLADTNDVSELYEWSSDYIKEHRVPSPIAKVERKVARQTVIINNGLLQATPFHSQLYKRDGIWRFDHIGSIKEGDYLYDINKSEIEVVNVEFSSEEKEIYPLALSPSHTYFANNILTHNVKQEV